MDEELGVKVPVTRLRRRLSVEADGAQSPATPSTPTKKRGTRLAKPALELIDEHVTDNVPKKTTRKSIARDVAEPAEAKAVTPSRRSARIRSNTSLVLETNPNVVESPRAKRAVRRISQLGSDTESTTTPVKLTRRTRKDSTSSVENIVVTNPNEKVVALVAEAIAEEPEKEDAKNSLSGTTVNSPTIRKSPRLNKKGKKSIDALKDTNDKQGEKDKTINESKQKTDEPVNTNGKTDTKLESKDSDKENISLTSASLLNDIDTNPKRSSVLNKTTSAIEELKNENNNRKRTKSWTTITSNTPTGDGNVYDKNIDKDKSRNNSGCGSGDSLFKNNEINQIKSPKSAVGVLNASETVKLLEKTPSKDVQSVVFIEDSDSNSGENGKLIIDLQNGGEDQCVPVVKQPTSKRSSTSESFSVEPMDIDETIPENVTINDFSDKTDSSREEDKMICGSQRKSSISKEISNKSIRTSISLQQESNNSKRKSSIGDSGEKKETTAALNRLSFSDKSPRKSSMSVQDDDGERLNENANKSRKKSSLTKVESDNDKRKSSLSSQGDDSDKLNNSVNKSKRKSGSEGESQNLAKTPEENKSTLVLSQLRDISANEMSNVSKSPNDTNNELLKPAKETVKKNMSLNYLTSTPLQQKQLQKIEMQINTSVISPNAESKNNSKVDKKTPKKLSKEKKVSNVTYHSDSSHEDSSEDSKIIENEAEEASYNYESGDSRNDEERQYEVDHELIEKGETLESEEEFSDNSDYEKGSFLASSDEEDDDLLSGSGDDLSLSDKELNMTAKSKKKFDESKRKEQKKASKEMYEARHRLDESDKSVKSKTKLKRQRLESSVLESEKILADEPKKKNRLRIDSSQDVSLNNSDSDGSIRIKEKKTKRLSESMCEENAVPNEKEISIFNQSVGKNDPLSVVVKQEPKTPLKDLNMSAILITDNIEEVQLDGNASVMKPNGTSDPLQATLSHEDEESDSDISENMEIKGNYDSVLESLNKGNNKLKKIKTLETSLNLNKKTTDKVKEPIMDQLNLTQTKKSKKNQARDVKEREISKESKSLKKNNVSVMLDKNYDGDISDSIDMRLLFPEDSNDSGKNAIRLKLDEHQDVEPVDEFIPLKRTEAKTNIRESLDLSLSKNESELNVSKKKHKNRKSSQCIPEPAITDEPEDTNVSFFIDTKGTYDDMDISTHNSAKKHKQNLSVNNVQIAAEFNETVPETPVTEETPVNVSLKSDEKKKKKNKSFDVSQIIDATVTQETPVNVSLKSDEKKKKKNKSFDDSQIIDAIETPVNVSLTSDEKKKKKNKSFDVSQIIDATVTEEIPVNVSLKSDKKNKSFVVSQIIDGTVTAETPVNVSLKSDEKKKKKNKSFDVSQIIDAKAPEELQANISVKSDKKKKKNKSPDVSLTAPEELQANVSVSSEKKKKKNKALDVSLAAKEEATENVSLKSDKKKKKNKALDAPEIVEASEEIQVNTDQVKTDKKKKKNKALDVPQIVDNTGDDSDEAPMEVAYKSEKNTKSDVADHEDDVVLTNRKNKFKKNKKKNKKTAQQQTDVNAVNTQEMVVTSKKRKRDMEVHSTDAADDEIKILKNSKKPKISQSDEPNPEVLSKNRSKKRKADNTQDDGQKKSKVFKENSFDKIHVPRLPESVVNQLDDMPSKQSKKQKKIKAIATVPFEVEEGENRKNKPSNYLEQSIYLNDTPVKKKQKTYIKNPKVLPFIPTAITSGKGYTSNFRLNVLPEDNQFVAQASNLANFKNDYLSNQRIKKLRTFERYKKQRNQKLSKF